MRALHFPRPSTISCVAGTGEGGIRGQSTRGSTEQNRKKAAHGWQAQAVCPGTNLPFLICSWPPALTLNREIKLLAKLLKLLQG